MPFTTANLVTSGGGPSTIASATLPELIGPATVPRTNVTEGIGASAILPSATLVLVTKMSTSVSSAIRTWPVKRFGLTTETERVLRTLPLEQMRVELSRARRVIGLAGDLEAKKVEVALLERKLELQELQLQLQLLEKRDRQ